jgi:hypothetical protein
VVTETALVRTDLAADRFHVGLVEAARQGDRMAL